MVRASRKVNRLAAASVASTRAAAFAHETGGCAARRRGRRHRRSRERDECARRDSDDQHGRRAGHAGARRRPRLLLPARKRNDTRRASPSPAAEPTLASPTPPARSPTPRWSPGAWSLTTRPACDSHRWPTAVCAWSPTRQTRCPASATRRSRTSSPAAQDPRGVRSRGRRAPSAITPVDLGVERGAPGGYSRASSSMTALLRAGVRSR